MRKLVLDIQDLNYSPDFLGASPQAFGAWVRLCMYSAHHMTGGKIEGCKTWDSVRWARACGLDWASVTACTEGRLAEWGGTDLELIGYPIEQEKTYKAKSKGAGLARSKRLHKSLSHKRDSDVSSDIKADITSLPFSSDSSSLSSRSNADEMDLMSPPGKSAPASDSDHWRMQLQHEPWARSLRDALCKIGPGTWRQWSTIIAEHGLPATIATAKGIPASDRWPDNVSDTLTASRGQENPGDAIAHKIVRLTL